MYDSHGHANALKIDVIRRPLTKCHGLWLPDTRTIVLRAGMRPNREHEVLAHEIGHAVAGHEGDSSANEVAADHYASRRLIDRRDYEAAILSTRSLLEAAQQLGVTTRMLRAYINGTVALGAPSYLASRLLAVADCPATCNLA